MLKPSRRSRASRAIPRIDPVPTAPAPPIWNTDFGRMAPGPTGGISNSVRRKCSWPAGLPLPLRPQNGARQALSHDSPSTTAASQSSGAPATPRDRRYQAGNEKAKSSPTASSSPDAAWSTSQPASSAAARPLDRQTSSPAATSAAQMCRAAPCLRPDQSTAMVRSERKRSVPAHLRRPPGRAEALVLPGKLAEGDQVPAPRRGHRRQAGPLLAMHDLGPRHAPDLPAPEVHPQRDVDVVEVEAEPLVHQADLAQGGAAHHGCRARDPVHGPGIGVVPVVVDAG